MTTEGHPFPETQPEVEVISRPGAELKEILRVDAGGFFVPLQVGGEAVWSFYDWPERTLTYVSHTRVIGLMKYRGRVCLDVVDRALWPEGESWATRWLYLVENETMTWLLREMRDVSQPGKPGTICEVDITPHPLRMRAGVEWEGHEVYRCGDEVEGEGQVNRAAIDGPYQVVVPTGTMLCLRENLWILGADGQGNSMGELYVADTGRSIYFRRYNGPAWRNYDELGAAGVPEREHDGVVWRLWYECLPDISL